MYVVAEVPCPKFTLPVLNNVNVGTETVSGIANEALCEPEVPMILKLYWPGFAESDAVNVRWLLLVAGFEEKDAVTPLGRPEAVSSTLPVKPNCGLTSIQPADVEVPW